MCVHVFPISFQTDILDINDIFRDLGTLVSEQGDMIGVQLTLKVHVYIRTVVYMYYKLKYIC